MAYEKRVCVLKQIQRGFSADGGTLSGAVYAERLGSDLTIVPKLAGVAPLREGSYAIAVWAGGKIYCLELGGNMRIPDAPSLAGGFSALLCFVKTEAQPLAYGQCGSAPRDYAALLNAFAESPQGKHKRRQTEESEVREKLIVPSSEEEANARPFRPQYDDEAIASTDYYGVSESGEDAGSGVRVQEKNEAQPREGDSCQNDGALPPRPVGRTLAYYGEVKEKLDDAFARFPKDERLKSIFPHSDWACSNGALVGIVYEEGLPKYLCVAAEASGTVSEEMKEHGIFVPATHFSDEEGFYVVFQDADTGEYVRITDS
ncbi:MAG: hypothetical protein K2H43_06010 [Clostridia bacterium]|nr:hypothetical protein [Clostridia bacterium]